MAREGTGTFFFNLQKSREAQYMKNLKTKRWCYTKQQLASEKKEKQRRKKTARLCEFFSFYFSMKISEPLQKSCGNNDDWSVQFVLYMTKVIFVFHI